MSRFKSGIILENRVVIAPGENESHRALLESLGIVDDCMGETHRFVRAERVPENGEWWINPEEHPGKWHFIVDQDITPDWFETDKETYEKEFRAAVSEWWKSHVLIDQKIDELTTGYYRLKNCEVKKLRNDVVVWLYDSQIGEMCDSSQVGRMYGSSQVGRMYDNSQVGRMYDNSQVGEMYHGSQVGRMYHRSQVGEMYNISFARSFKEYPKIKIMVPDNGRFEMVLWNNKDEEEK